MKLYFFKLHLNCNKVALLGAIVLPWPKVWCVMCHMMWPDYNHIVWIWTHAMFLYIDFFWGEFCSSHISSLLLSVRCAVCNIKCAVDSGQWKLSIHIVGCWLNQFQFNPIMIVGSEEAGGGRLLLVTLSHLKFNPY